MARPSCSRNEPKTFRSSGATVRRESTKMRDTVELVWAERKRPKTRFAEQARPPAIVACRKPRRLEGNIGQSSRAKAGLARCKSQSNVGAGKKITDSQTDANRKRLP